MSLGGLRCVVAAALLGAGASVLHSACPLFGLFLRRRFQCLPHSLFPIPL